MSKKLRKILLFNSVARADAYAEKLALKGEGLNVRCTTSTNYLKDLLLTTGLDFQIVDNVSRLAFIISIVNNLPSSFAKSYFKTDASIELLCQLVKSLAGCNYFHITQNINTNDIKMSQTLSSIAIILADHYFVAIESGKLVEIGTFARHLKEIGFKPSDEIVVMDNMEMQSAVYDYYKYLGATGTIFTDPSFVDYDSSFGDKPVEVDILTGSRARTDAIIETVKNNKGKNILISSSDPDLLFTDMKALVADQDDISLSLKSSTAFKDTYFGQQLINAFSIYLGKGSDMTALSDFAQNPYSGMSKFQALAYDKRLRSNTFSGGPEEINYLMRESENAEKFFSLFSDGGTNIDKVLAEIGKIAYSCERFTEPIRATETATIHAIRNLNKMLFNLGFQETLNPNLISWLAFSQDRAFGPEDAQTKITIVSNSQVKREATHSYDIVIGTDISTLVYNATSNMSSVDKLLELADISKLHSEIVSARIDFASIGEVAKDKIVLLLPLRSDSFDEVFTSFPAQEKFGIKSDKLNEIVDTFKNGGAEVKVFGEENLVTTCAHNIKAVDECESRTFTLWKNDLNHRSDFAKFLTFERYHGQLMPVLSPSQIESYISCPLKWFYNRKINASGLDYDFNALVQGNIVHETYRRFYEELKKKNVNRLVVDEMKKYDDIFAKVYTDVFDEAMSNGVTDIKKLHSNVFLEAHQRENLYYECGCNLHLHASLPKDYYVGECEFNIMDQGLFEYAGALINGRIDRIDYCDTDNTFMVLDYKAKVKSIKPGYYVYDDDGNLVCSEMPSNLQSLIYSSVFERISDRKCKAALYVAYLRPSGKGKRFVNGAVDPSIANAFIGSMNATTFDLIEFQGEGERYDRAIIEPVALIPFSIQEVMEATENAIAPYIERIVAGDIEPQPSERSNCRFCDVSGCLVRK